MSDYKLKDTASKLGAKSQKFTFLKGSKGTEVVISPADPTHEVLESVTKRIGPNHAETKGRCYKDEAGVIVFAAKDLSKEGLIRETFRKASVSSKLIFRAPKPEEEQLDASDSSEGSSSGDQPKPVTTNAPVLPVPNRPPPQPPTRTTPLAPGNTGNTSGESASAALQRRGGLVTPPTGQRPPQPTGNPGGPPPTTAQRPATNTPPQPPPRSTQPIQPTAQPPSGSAVRPSQPATNPSASAALRQRGGLVTPPTNPGAATGAATTATPPRATGNTQATTNPTPARTLPSAGKVEIGGKFPKAKMDQIKAETNRGIFKGMGEFKEVFKGMEGLQVAEKKLKDAAKGQPLDAKSVAFLTSRYDALIANVDSYQDKFNDDGTAKVPNRKRKNSSDSKRDAKFKFSDEARAAALEARTQLKHPDKAATMETLARKNAAGGLTDGEERTFHQTRAELMMLAQDNGAVEQATGGTSDVKLLRSFDGSVGYVFKSVAGESDQLQLAKGAGTAAEIMTSKVSETIKKRCGFDAGFPKTTLATLPTGGTGGTQGTPGALIEGLAGEPFRDPQGEDPYEEYGKRQTRSVNGKPKSAEQIQKDREWRDAQDAAVAAAGVTGADEADAYSNMIRKRETDKALAIPAATVQKIIMMNLMSSSADIKWTNVMADGAEARPFDGGGNMLSEKAMMEAAQARRADSGRGIKDGDIDPLFGTDMLWMPDKTTKHPSANQPLDQAMVRQILSLDPDEIAADMTEEVRQLKAGSSDFDNAVGDSNVQSCKRSIQALQAALRRNVNATTEEFVNAYNDEVKTWLNEVKNRG